MRTKGGVRVLAKNFAEFSSRYRNWLAGSLVVAIAAIGMQPAQAEGSRDLIEGAAGRRPFLDARGPGNPNAITGRIPRRTPIFVYAEQGETLNLGSSAHGLGQGTINFTAPNGVTTGTCAPPTAANFNAGRILNINEEIAGPDPTPVINPAANPGYTPCVVPVTQTGIWRIDFVSPNPNNPADPPLTFANANWTQGNNVSWIAAWDVTVRSTLGAITEGRVYANFLPLNLGGNVAANALRSALFIQTVDGYLYDVDFNDIDPYGYIFFANSRGFLDPPPPPVGALYRSVSLINPVPNYQTPDVADVPPEDFTHKIFLNDPRTTLLPPSATLDGTSTWLRPLTVTPPAPTNFAFIGQEGTPNQAGTVPLTGSFTFDAPTSSTPVSYRIVIDISGDGTFGNANDRILFGTTRGGSNSVVWDGRDGAGNPVPAGALNINAEITLNAGEIHFPLLDVENNAGGIRIERLEPTNAPGNRFIVYFNDQALGGANGLAGVDSSGGAHAFTNNFGNDRGIDTWTFVPSLPARLSANIILAQADLAITKAISPSPVVPGNTVTFTLVVTNNGPSNVTGARVTDTVPTLTNVTWTCAVTTGVGNCPTPSGSGNNIDTTVDLNNGAAATFTITGTLPLNATGTLTNEARVLRPNDVTDPNDPGRQGAGNNRAAAAAPIAPAGPLLGVAKQVGTPVDNGDGTFTVPYTVTVTNLGTVLLENLQLTDNLTTAYQSAVSFSVVAAPSSSTLTGNPGFTGVAPNINLLTGTDQLPVGASATINYSVRVNPGANLGPYNNTVRGNATGGGTPVSDDSTVGINPDPNNDGLPDERTPTPVNFNQAPNLVLVKRITAATRAGTPLTFSNFVDDPSDPDDTAPGWSQLSPIGVPALDGTNPLNSGDEVEYTIYFLSNGNIPALDVNLCDLISPGSTFVTNTNQVRVANSSPTTGGVFFSPLSPLPAGNSCTEQTNQNGALIFNLGTVSNTAGSNFGFVRFRVRVD